MRYGGQVKVKLIAFMDQSRSDNSRVAAREKERQAAPPSSPFVTAPPQKANYDHIQTRNQNYKMHIKTKAIYGILDERAARPKMDIQVIIVNC